ncbi:MAG TPA: DNA mismatch repair protein MutS [Ktedonobacteraceae bacterium]|nr:DNA mismatch repair protein MutS [Ktedonobacteraceae bacterium]
MPSTSTPARRQYLQMKSQYPDAILLYQVGDFYETFDEDAVVAARVLQIVLTKRAYGEERVPLAGIPLHALDNYVGKLVQQGYKVAICDQVGEVGHGLVERAVTRILTAGTLSEPNLLPARRNNFLIAASTSNIQTAMAAVDVSTGEFSVTWFAPDEMPGALEAELQRLAPTECLLVEGSRAGAFALPQETMTITQCPPYFFEVDAARARLCRLFGVQSLDAYGCAHAPQAIAAAGAIVVYLEKMNAKLLALLTGLKTYHAAGYMTLDAHTQRNLELLQSARGGSTQGSLLGVLDRTITPMGARQMRRALCQPLLDLAELEARLDSVEELYESPALRSRFTMHLQRLGDIERIAGRARQGTAVLRETLAMREYLLAVPTLQNLLRGCNATMLVELANELDACPQVTTLIEQALARDDGEDEQGDSGRLIRAGFHAELDELIASIRESRRWVASLEARERERTGIKSLRVSYNKVFGYSIEVSNSKRDLVPPDYLRKQTLVNAERYITPELKEHEARIASAEARIEELERSIYADVLRQVAVYYPQMIATARALAQVDVLLSFAEVAAHAGYTRPGLEQSGVIEITGGRHPVVERSLDGEAFIPNDTRMDEEARIVLLTGPNMAGKSTYLRQVALITLMAQMGSFVPARGARIGLVDRIFTRVGAEDDIASGKSTFMVEMEETAAILRHATRHSLVILDEIGRGTSTYDGLAIARAVVEHLHNTTLARTLFATHYHELSAMADELSSLRVQMMAISEDEQDGVIFLHRVVPGSAGRSYGVHVAKMAGMPGGIVQRASEVLNQLETAKTMAVALNGNGALDGHNNDNGYTRLRVADGNGTYSTGARIGAMRTTYTWQSEEARMAASVLERDDGEHVELDTIDVSAITPLDALNLLYLLQKKRKRDYPTHL